MSMYDQMLDELSDELPEIETRVLQALRKNPQGLRRPQLVAIVFGESVKAGGMNNNDTRDRKIRKAIESLRGRLVPIVSSSREAGYRLDVSETARRAMIADLESRRDRLNDLISRARRFYQLPESGQPSQGRLM